MKKLLLQCNDIYNIFSSLFSSINVTGGEEFAVVRVHSNLHLHCSLDVWFDRERDEVLG